MFVLKRDLINGITLTDVVLDANIASIKSTVEGIKVVTDATKVLVDIINDEIAIEREREIFVYPDSTSLTCTITAGAPADTWSAWAEITDSGANTFSSKVTSRTHITMLILEDVGDLNNIYYIEVSYGAAKTIVARRRMLPGKEMHVIGIDMFGKLIPVGEIVYARMMSTKAGGTAQISIRYHYHS